MNSLTIGESLFLILVPSLAIVIVATSFFSMRLAGVERAFWFVAIFASILGLWLMTVYLLSSNGWISVWNAFPPRIPLLVFTAIAAYVVSVQTRVAKSSLIATPMWLPVLIQTFRIVVEFALWQLHREGSVPIQFTLEGRNIDMLVGLTAPLIALGIAMKRIGPKSTMAWNLFGLSLLINAMFIAATSSPGPQHLDWPGEPFTAIATWPLVWLPSFLAPTAVFLHLASMIQGFAAIKQSYRD